MKEIKELLRELEPVIGKQAAALWKLALLSEDVKDKEEQKTILRNLASLYANHNYQYDIILPPPNAESIQGDINVGTIQYANKEMGDFALKESELIKHTLITGMTGSGKTNLSFHLLKQLIENNKPFLVFDWKKNYRDIKQLPEFKDLQIIRIGSTNCQFKFNPLIPPPGVEIKHWMTMLIDIIKHAFFVGHGVEYFMRKGIDTLYKRFDSYNGKQTYPSFSDLERLMNKEFVKGREMLWMASTKRVLSCLTFSGILGEVLNVQTQPDIAKILNQNIIIEMDNLATIEKIFFVESLLLWIYEYRKQQQTREKFKHCIVIEEAHHILSKKKELKSGTETITETIMRMIREYGEGIIVIDQEPQKISDSVLSNTYTKINFNLGNGKDIRTIAEAMNLDQEQRRMIDLLQTGHAIVKSKRFSQPVHVKIPHIKIQKGKYRDEEVNTGRYPLG